MGNGEKKLRAKDRVMHFEIDPDLKRRLRLACVERDETLGEFATRAIEERLGK